MVLISKKNKRKVYEYLLNEGVIVVKKDFALLEHKDTGVSNLQVLMLLKSLTSKGLVELVFNWHYYYYFVKTNGVKYLRETLGIHEEVIPITYKKVKRNYTGRDEGDDGDRGNRPRGRGGRGRGGRGRGFGRGRRTEEQQQEGEQENPQGQQEENQLKEQNYQIFGKFTK